MHFSLSKSFLGFRYKDEPEHYLNCESIKLWL